VIGSEENPVIRPTIDMHPDENLPAADGLGRLVVGDPEHHFYRTAAGHHAGPTYPVAA